MRNVACEIQCFYNIYVKKPFRNPVRFGRAASSVYVLSTHGLTFLFPPLLGADAPVAELHDLFCKKLQQCCVLFDFLDCVADLKGKEIKRAALNELVESVATSRGVLIEPLYPEAIKMVRVQEGARGGKGLNFRGQGIDKWMSGDEKDR